MTALQANQDTGNRSAPPHSPLSTLLWLIPLLALVALGITWAANLGRIQASYPGLSPAVPLAVDKSYGVNVDLTSYPPEAFDREVSRMSALGLRWIRQPFPWAEVEPARGLFNWERWDRVVAAARRHNLQIIAVLDTAPDWARPAGNDRFTPPAELADFGAFAGTLAARYGDQIGVYQIWDEPNLSSHWGSHYVDPLGYARLLREGAIAIRAANPRAVVLTASLAPAVDTGPLNLNEPEFMARLYAANAAPWFDAVAAQPYGFEDAPEAPANPARLNLNHLELLRQTMVEHGDGSKAIWATAFGWSALPPDWAGSLSPWPLLRPGQDAAAFTRQAVRQARADWPWLGPMLFAAWDAAALAPDDPRRGLALVAGDTPLLADAMLSDDTATVGDYPADAPSGHYSGAWRVSPAGADAPVQAQGTLTIPFEGTRLDMTVRRGNFRGYLYVTIDGQPANSLPQPRVGRSYIVLYDPLEKQETVTLARYLPDGPHTAVVQPEGGWYLWPIVGWRVSREGDTRALGWGLALVGVLAVLAAGGLARSARGLPWRGPVQAIITWGERLYRRYLALGTPVHLLAVALVALAFYAAPGMLLSLGLLGLLALTILPRPDLGLTLAAFWLPFFLLPKPLVGQTISMTEVSLVLVALACVVRRALTLSAARNRFDWAAWLLTGAAAVAGLLTVMPALAVGPLSGADWPALTLLLLPPAGILALVAGNRQDSKTANQPIGRGVLWLARNLDLAVAALVGLALAATLAAQNFGVANLEFHVVVWDAAAFYAFIRLLPDPLLAGERGSRVVWQIVDAWLLGATLMALYAIYQVYFTGQTISAEGVQRALGIYGSPNNLALLLDRAVPILVAVAAFGGPHRRQILYGLALIPAAVALHFTYSRGALLLGIPAALLFIGLARGKRAFAAMVGVLIVLGTTLVPQFSTDRFRTLADTSEGTGFFRLRLWQSAWAMLGDHPWLGVGLDNFLYQYRTHYILPDAWEEPNLSHPHNILLDFATRLGVGGLIVLAWLQVAFWLTAWPLYRRLPQAADKALILGLMGSMVATLAHGLVDQSFFLVDLAFIFALALGGVRRLSD
jgi:O-antigen ligase